MEAQGDGEVRKTECWGIRDWPLASSKAMSVTLNYMLMHHPDDAGWTQVHGLWRSSCTHMVTQCLEITHIFLEKVNQMITFMSLVVDRKN